MLATRALPEILHSIIFVYQNLSRVPRFCPPTLLKMSLRHKLEDSLQASEHHLGTASVWGQCASTWMFHLVFPQVPLEVINILHSGSILILGKSAQINHSFALSTPPTKQLTILWAIHSTHRTTLYLLSRRHCKEYCKAILMWHYWLVEQHCNV